MGVNDERESNVTRLYPTDTVFFSKNDLFVGAVLTYYGRHDPGSQWRVTQVRRWYAKGTRWRKVQSPERLMDTIYLERVAASRGRGGNKASNHMQLNFQYISYSAIWRLTP